MSTAEHIQKDFAEVNGIQLYYEVAGEGHPLVLIHGLLLDRRSWDEQFEAFAQHYKVVRFDLRGYGDSGIVKQEAGPYSWHQDVYELLKFLGIEKAYLMGVSGGGALALDFTLEHPEMVDGLILVAAGVSGYQPSEEDMKKYPEVTKLFMDLQAAFDNKEIAQAVELSLQLWTDGPFRSGQANHALREQVRAMTAHNWGRPDDDINSTPLESPAIGRLGEVKTPTLVILGEYDAPNALDTLIAEFPNGKKIVMEQTAHHPHMEKPAEFNQIVLDFLGSLE